MKNVFEKTEYIPQTKVIAWLAEAREIIAQYPRIGEHKLYTEHSFTWTGYKVSYIAINELLKRIDKYPHTSFANRPELIKLAQRIASQIDTSVEFELSKTVEVIRLSDGAHLMVTPETAKDAVEEFKVAKYA